MFLRLWLWMGGCDDSEKSAETCPDGSYGGLTDDQAQSAVHVASPPLSSVSSYLSVEDGFNVALSRGVPLLIHEGEYTAPYMLVEQVPSFTIAGCGSDVTTLVDPSFEALEVGAFQLTGMRIRDGSAPIVLLNSQATIEDIAMDNTFHYAIGSWESDLYINRLTVDGVNDGAAGIYVENSPVVNISDTVISQVIEGAVYRMGDGVVVWRTRLADSDVTTDFSVSLSDVEIQDPARAGILLSGVYLDTLDRVSVVGGESFSWSTGTGIYLQEESEANASIPEDTYDIVPDGEEFNISP